MESKRTVAFSFIVALFVSAEGLAGVPARAFEPDTRGTPPTGACCEGSVCFITTQEICVDAFEGIWMGPDSNCEAETCLGGSPTEPGPMETPPASPCIEPSWGSRVDASVMRSTYLFSGETYDLAMDLRIRGRGLDFVWARKYRSREGVSSALGNWDYSYNIYLEQAGAHRILHDGNSRADLYTLRPNGKWARDEFFRELEVNGDNTYTLVFVDSGEWNFHAFTHPTAPGRISSIVDRTGNNVILFSYDAQGRLQTITDTLARNISLAYDGNNRITSVTDFAGRQVVYTYYTDPEIGGSNGDLKSVRSPIVNVSMPANHNNFPAGKTTTYTYSEGFGNPNLNGNLLTIIDPKGQLYLTNTYGTNDRLITQIWGNQGPGAALTDRIDVVYTAVVPGPANNNAVIKATVNDRVGNVRVYFYDAGKAPVA